MKTSTEKDNKLITKNEICDVRAEFLELRREMNRKFDIIIGLLEEKAARRKRLEETLQNLHRRT